MHRPLAHTDVFQAVADPTRRAILARLRRGRAAASELAEGFPISRPAVSKHLGVLRRARLVREHREGRHRIYELSAGPIRDIARWTESYRDFWEANLASLKQHLERR
ncbi:MAG TPA: metalloregulator ArsR/SmtB family transcription factor [Longimicrobiales bacterium]|nr:metalloregulator ArsR/SmtB family transcription factor [Longimicrobiales bacterium]